MTSSHRDLEPDGTAVRTAVLVGFPRGLEDALSVLLRSRQFTVRITPSARKATELIQTAHVDLVESAILDVLHRNSPQTRPPCAQCLDAFLGGMALRGGSEQI